MPGFEHLLYPIAQYLTKFFNKASQSLNLPTNRTVREAHGSVPISLPDVFSLTHNRRVSITPVNNIPSGFRLGITRTSDASSQADLALAKSQA